MPFKIFISKNPSEVSQLNADLSDQEVILEAKSFLYFEPVPFRIDSEFDVLFFSSPRSVTFFMSQYAIPRNKVIACVGQKTETLLKSLSCQPEFVGTSSDPRVIGEEFALWLNKRTVLFPLSDISKKTIFNCVAEDQRMEVVAYSTKKQSIELQKFDCYVFTSPSNVDAFFASGNKIENSLIIAWGASTSGELSKHNIEHEVLKEPSMHCLKEFLQNKNIIK